MTQFGRELNNLDKLLQADCLKNRGSKKKGLRMTKDEVFAVVKKNIMDVLFNLNSEQYKKKRAQLNPVQNTHVEKRSAPNFPKLKSNIEQDTPVQFCEAVVTSKPEKVIPTLAQAAQKNKRAVAKLKSPNNQSENYLDTMTIIVECIRPDGHRLKIHTTTDRLEYVMQAFFTQEAAAQ